MQNGIYFRLGQLASMCLVHGGAAIRVFSPSVYSFLCGKRPSDIDVKVCEVFEFGVKDLVNKVCLYLFMMYILECGFRFWSLKVMRNCGHC